MNENTLTIRLTPNNNDIKSDDVLKMIFYRHRGSPGASKDQKHYEEQAKKIIQLSASREHLYDNAYKQVSKDLNLQLHEYHFIIKKLKLAGIIYKRKGIYRVDNKFLEHLHKLFTVWRDFMDELERKPEADVK